MNATIVDLSELTSTEMLTGILTEIGGLKFPEQAVYRFFQNLEHDHPELKGRFQITAAYGRLKSEPVLRIILSFLEMSKILEVPMPNPVDQHYRARQSQVPSIRQELTRRGVLPRHADTFKQLAKEFVESTEPG